MTSGFQLTIKSGQTNSNEKGLRLHGFLQDDGEVKRIYTSLKSSANAASQPILPSNQNPANSIADKDRLPKIRTVAISSLHNSPLGIQGFLI